MISVTDFQKFSDQDIGSLLMEDVSENQYSSGDILKMQQRLSNLKSRSSLLKNVELSEFSLNIINKLQ